MKTSFAPYVRLTTLCLAILLPLQAAAVEFVFVGSRQMGMGGAGVATTSDSLATYWNPAGMAMSKKFDIRFQGSGQVVDLSLIHISEPTRPY